MPRQYMKTTKECNFAKKAQEIHELQYKLHLSILVSCSLVGYLSGAFIS